jgi:hypothetical protein
MEPSDPSRDPDEFRDQIVANLIDYCDGDDLATTDFDDTAFTATFAGVEKVPYLSEVGMQVYLERDALGSISVTVRMTVEVVNMWEQSVTCDIRGRAMFSFTSTDTGNVSDNLELEIDNFSFLSTDRYPCTAVFDLTPTGSFPVPLADPVVLTNISLTNIRIALSPGVPSAPDEIWDFARLNDTLFDNLAVAAVVGESVQSERYQYASDPRANTVALDWRFSTIPPDMTDIPTLTSVNPLNIAADDDDEPSISYPWETSTAFVRNAPIRSLWELGCISRAEPWRTINLKAFGTTGEYGDGDAAILDQVKLGPFLEMRGKFNVNSPQPAAWRPVLQNVKVGSDSYEEPDTGSAVTDTGADDIVDDPDGILDENGTTNGDAFYNRGQIAQAVTLSDGTGGTQTTDREQEEIIGKIANLLTTRQNYFTIIATSQILRDTGKDLSGLSTQAGDDRIAYQLYTESNLVKFDSGADDWAEILAEQKVMAIVYRDAFRNRFRLERLELLTE